MTNDESVANPGITLGEAVGALIERELNRILAPIVQEYGAVYVTAGKSNPRTGKATKLLMTDDAGNTFNIGSVVANNRLMPLVLIGTAFIDRKKLQQDQMSAFHSTHDSIQRRYPTIQQSFCFLLGRRGKDNRTIQKRWRE